ncbi:hypothetical protein EDD18DRAFT_1108558 [Armillaria luteobubalina]|uniref:Uncharacterized protein n=1 Tax=Armillaria luteobubalina TaxID=153913 RepID=A0AA39Q199_9AGAR|nr:hypothetical protein EDD18DRAFT_1108558 [Armillaria luteobubalina]
MTPFSPVDAQPCTSHTFFKETTRAYEQNKQEVLDELLHSQDNLLFCDKQPILNLELDDWTPVLHGIYQSSDGRGLIVATLKQGQSRGSERAGIDIATTCDRSDWPPSPHIIIRNSTPIGPTARDRRINQQTCHATGISYEYIASTALSFIRFWCSALNGNDDLEKDFSVSIPHAIFIQLIFCTISWSTSGIPP